eukprot:764673-Hanusia_phi.AAC.6
MLDNKLVALVTDKEIESRTMADDSSSPPLPSCSSRLSPVSAKIASTLYSPGLRPNTRAIPAEERGTSMTSWSPAEKTTEACMPHGRNAPHTCTSSTCCWSSGGEEEEGGEEKDVSYIRDSISGCWTPDGQDRGVPAAEGKERRRHVEERSVDHPLLDDEQTAFVNHACQTRHSPAGLHLKLEVSLTLGGFPTPGGTTTTAARLITICPLSAPRCRQEIFVTCSTTASLAD